MNSVYIASACRTPIGKTAGSLSKIGEIDMMSMTFSKVIEKSGLCTKDINGVYVGCCFPKEAYNIARKSSIAANIPPTIPGVTINRTCCSSMEALVQGARQIMVGDADIVAVGGIENMSNSPHVMRNAIKNIRSRVNDRLPTLNEVKSLTIDDVGMLMEIFIKENNISRTEQDELSILSHKKANDAIKKGYLSHEIFPVKIEGTGNTEYLDYDENVSTQLSMDDYRNEKLVYLDNGTITKLNSSSINDGAAAMILISQKEMEKRDIKPIAKLISSEVIGVDPKDTALAPAYAIKKLLKKTNVPLKNLGLIECNEAYAAQYIACQRMMNWSNEKVNIHGGSIALGHPLGCTGLRICITLIYAMRLKDIFLGVASMCAGGGMGQAIMFQSCNM